MCLAKMRQNNEHGRPHADEKGNNEDQDLVLRNRHVPKETPVSTVGL